MGKTVQLYAPDISCQHCAMAIQRALRPIEGLSRVEVNVQEKIITLAVENDEALAKAKAVLEEIGYPVKNPSR